MQLQHPRSDVYHESEETNNDAENVDDIVTIARHITRAAPSETPLLVDLDRAGEGLSNQGSLQLSLQLGLTRIAGSTGERVDETKYKVSRECTTQVGNTAGR